MFNFALIVLIWGLIACAESKELSDQIVSIIHEIIHE